MSLLLALTGGSGGVVRPYTETYTRLGTSGVSQMEYGPFTGRAPATIDIPGSDTWGVSWDESGAIGITAEVAATDTWGISWTESALVDTDAVAPPTTPESTGGFIAAYDLWRAHSQVMRRKLQDDEEQALEQTSADEAAQEIARFLHEQAKRDAQREELARLRALVLAQPLPDELNERSREALRVAREKQTTGAMLALSRALIRQQEEEHFLVTAALMFDE